MQILLMSLVEPSGLKQKEIPLVFKLAGLLAPLVSLQRIPVGGQNKQCVFKIDEDKPPGFRANGVEVMADTAIRYLNFTLLYQFFEQQGKNSDPGDARLLNLSSKINKHIAKISAELLNYLQQRWLGVELHGTPLFADRQDRFIGIGLFATHDLNIASEIKKGEVALSHKEKLEPLLARSISDNMLSAKFNDINVFSVGSLVSFGKQSGYNHALGVVNKVNVIKHDGRITFGVQLLASHYCAVFCKRRQATEKEIPQRAAFYSKNVLREEKNYLITDYPFEDNDPINLSMERSRKRENFPIILKNRKNIAVGYWHFECHSIVEQPQSRPAQVA
jgi:cyclic-di-GMP-binding protein